MKNLKIRFKLKMKILKHSEEEQMLHFEPNCIIFCQNYHVSLLNNIISYSWKYVLITTHKIKINFILKIIITIIGSGLQSFNRRIIEYVRIILLCY